MTPTQALDHGLIDRAFLSCIPIPKPNALRQRRMWLLVSHQPHEKDTVKSRTWFLYPLWLLESLWWLVEPSLCWQCNPCDLYHTHDKKPTSPAVLQPNHRPGSAGRLSPAVVTTCFKQKAAEMNDSKSNQVTRKQAICSNQPGSDSNFG